MSGAGQGQQPKGGRRRVLVPWIVSSGDLRRYFGRGLDAAVSGRAVFVRVGRNPEPQALLLGVAKWKEYCASAREYSRGKYRVVRLADLPRKEAL